MVDQLARANVHTIKLILLAASVIRLKVPARGVAKFPAVKVQYLIKRTLFFVRTLILKLDLYIDRSVLNFNHNHAIANYLGLFLYMDCEYMMVQLARASVLTIKLILLAASVIRPKVPARPVVNLPALKVH
jgi:hypothetical protein